MSSRYMPEKIEVEAVEYWNNKKGRDPYAPPQPKDGYVFVSDREVSDIFGSCGRSFRIGPHEVLYAGRRHVRPLKGIIVERSDTAPHKEKPLVVELSLLREPLPVRALKRAIGVEPRAQFSLTKRVPESDDELKQIVDSYREFRTRQIHRDAPDGQPYVNLMAMMNNDCNKALERWGVQPAAE